MLLQDSIASHSPDTKLINEQSITSRSYLILLEDRVWNLLNVLMTVLMVDSLVLVLVLILFEVLFSDHIFHPVIATLLLVFAEARVRLKTIKYNKRL